MIQKKFDFWNRIVSLAVLLVACATYLLTIEPTASFWDCGEFIASSYKLEIGHPPGNPVFQLIARFFTLFVDAGHAAVAVNAMSALCSGFTIFFLYLTIVFFAKRLVRKEDDGTWSAGSAIAIFGSGAVGALAYCFSDTFWFSAVEGEVYAMSSLFTALVFWMMTKWYEQADRPYANRWIVLISFLMGLSIGVHLLNLLAIPALVFMFYYRKKEDGTYTFGQMLGIFLLSVVILGIIFFFLIPYLPKLAAHCDRIFVDSFHLPVNSGAAFFLAAVLALCFWGLFRTFRKGKVFWNTVLLCLTTIVVGFSIFSIVIIRSSVQPPTNENQPDNAYSLVRYLNREQYGRTPLVYGQYFDAPYEVKQPKYWALVDGKYIQAPAPPEAHYLPSGKMFFPRMWAGSPDGRYEAFYEEYMNGKGHPVAGADHKKPTFGTNLKFFFDYQMNWMYWRYFMWNFVGRQNDIHSPSPGEMFYGNWESGISFIDRMRLGDQSDAPDILARNKGKNHYYFLPLLLGLLGLFFQFDRDRRGCWLTFLMFFMTGIAIVLYLNQPPYQVRERDYAYAGSFYMFSIWIGFAVAALHEFARKRLPEKVSAAAVSALCLCVPVLMAAENWDDHDRSHRRTAVELARNYLESVGEQGLLITHGDNDTFPLWYAQEVESVRPDVRIVNTSLLGTDWYIGQMRYAINDSRPLPLTVPQSQYLYGTNEMVYIYDMRETVLPLSEVMRVFKSPEAKLTLQSGRRVDYICSRKISIPVNKENVLRSGILGPEYADQILDEIVLTIPAGKEVLSKPELFMLDLLDGYEWDRPINMLSQGGDINIGLRDYLMYEGFSAKLVPLRNSLSSTRGVGKVELDKLCGKMDDVFKWDALKRTDYFADYQNLYTFLGSSQQREIFTNVAQKCLEAGDTIRAVAMLDKCVESVPASVYPLETICLGFVTNNLRVMDIIDMYYLTGEKEKARAFADLYEEELRKSTAFFLSFYDFAGQEFEYCYQMIQYLSETYEMAGDDDRSEALLDWAENLLRAAVGHD